jgi:hypothetical protein
MKTRRPKRIHCVLSYYDEGGGAIKNIEAPIPLTKLKELSVTFKLNLEGGETALKSDELTFEDLANHYQRRRRFDSVPPACHLVTRILRVGLQRSRRK